MQHKLHSAVHIMGRYLYVRRRNCIKTTKRIAGFRQRGSSGEKQGFALCCKAVRVSPETTYTSLWNLVLTPSLCSYRFSSFFATAPYVDRRNRCRLSWIVASLSHRAPTIVYNNTSVTPSVVRFICNS